MCFCAEHPLVKRQSFRTAKQQPQILERFGHPEALHAIVWHHRHLGHILEPHRDIAVDQIGDTSPLHHEFPLARICQEAQQKQNLQGPGLSMPEAGTGSDYRLHTATMTPLCRDTWTLEPACMLSSIAILLGPSALNCSECYPESGSGGMSCSP